MRPDAAAAGRGEGTKSNNVPRRRPAPTTLIVPETQTRDRCRQLLRRPVIGVCREWKW